VNQQINKLISRIEVKKLPVVVVGGGASLYNCPEAIFPQHAPVANAFGAALAEKSHTITRVLSLEHRDETLKQLKQEIYEALKGEAEVQIDTVEVTPYNYLPGHLARYLVSGRRVKNSV
jgi:hypothetical protein